MSGITNGFDRAMRTVGKLFYYSFCTAAFAALGILLFSGAFTFHGIAKSTTVVKGVLDRFEPIMTFSPCPSHYANTEARCAVENGYEFYRDDYGYRISLASDPDRTPVITLSTRDTSSGIATARSEADLQKFLSAFARNVPGTETI